MTKHEIKGFGNSTKIGMAKPRVRLPAKPRVRLYGTSDAPAGFSGTERAPTAPQTGEKLGLKRATPEELAYALPAGLAKLALPHWVYGRWIKKVEDRLMDIFAGNQVYLMVSAPPRHGKTQFMSQVFPAFYLGHNPDNKVLFISYGTEYARKQGRAARNIFQRYGKRVFGLEVDREQSAAGSWAVDAHFGGMESVGAGGPITGKGANLLILDDAIKGVKTANSITMLDQLWEWFLMDVLSRLEPNASIIITATRWTSFDITGRILEMKAKKEIDPDVEQDFTDFEEINFPALATGKKDPIGRKKGEALFPERYTRKDLLKRKARSDDWMWEALYQGNPVPKKGNIINIEWFRRRYKDAPPRAKFEQVIISADTASKETEIADYTVFGIWGVLEKEYWLLDLLRERMEFPVIVSTMEELINQWSPEFTLIEDKATGTSLIQTLRTKQISGTMIWPIDPGQEGKVVRLQAETPVLRSGRIVLPESASWLKDFEDECKSFPSARRDQVDMLSQFLKFKRVQSSGIQMW